MKYTNQYDPTASSKNEPYQEYTPVEHSYRGDTWYTSINPNGDNSYIGTDMMTFECIDSEGVLRTIDNFRADGRGHIANLGNWMVQYTDNFTFINTGDTERTFKIYKKGATSGSLFTMVRDYNGNIISARQLCHPYYYADGQIPYGVDQSLLTLHNGNWWYLVDGVPYYELVDERAYICEVKVAPHSAEQISVDYLILGNSCGGIAHWVEVD